MRLYVVITVGLMIISFPIALKVGSRIGVLRLALQGFGDRRLKVINELLAGIRIVKYYAWEEAFFNNIDRFREEELKGLKSLASVRSAMLCILIGAVVIATGLTVVRLTQHLFLDND